MSDPANDQTLPNSMLSPDYREAAFQRLGSEQFDVVVIGGGVVGAGCALDAATRGLKVALVEARDFAAGTSSRSSKMFHGGCATSSSSNSGWCAKRCTSVNCR